MTNIYELTDKNPAEAIRQIHAHIADQMGITPQALQESYLRTLPKEAIQEWLKIHPHAIITEPSAEVVVKWLNTLYKRMEEPVKAYKTNTADETLQKNAMLADINTIAAAANILERWRGYIDKAGME